jgi:uncharacterized protein (DUF885 family)
MERRQFLGSAAATAALSLLPASRAAAQLPPLPPSPPQDAPLNVAFDAVLKETIADSPMFATSLGFDKGPWAKLRHQLDDNSYGALKKNLDQSKRAKKIVAAVDPAKLSPQGRVDREVVLYNIDQRIEPTERFGLGSPQQPYVLSQQDGAYFGIPDFLASVHPVQTADDAEAYLDRLAGFDTQLDNDSEYQRIEAKKGRVAPDFSLDLTLAQLKKLREVPAGESGMVSALVTRAKDKNLPGDWAARATKIVESEVYPALDRQIALVETLRKSARKEAGLWAIPDGEAIYAAGLAQATTTNMTPDEVHKLGLAQVADLTARLDTILKGEGLTTGSVGERLTALNKRPDQLYPDTDAGRAELLRSLNAGNAAMQAKLGQAFSNPPNAPLEIKRVDPSIQDGAPNGYYYRAPLDGSRPAIYWINLKSVGDWPKYSLPSLTYHEGVPGHHLQISTSQRAPVHTLRKLAFFNAYLEGWALYSEQLADELKGYATPVEQAGYLQSFLFRAARLVVDTGIHTKRWSREQATDYFVNTVGFARGRSQREIERYCVSPGQACSYKIGHAAWLRARENAQKIAGAKFDLKKFHDVLEYGAMPLSMLERIVEEQAKSWS